MGVLWSICHETIKKRHDLENESVILELPDKLWNLFQIGVGGYVIGRSAEKIDESKWGSK